MEKIIYNRPKYSQDDLKYVHDLCDSVRAKCDEMTNIHLNKIKVKEVKNESIEPGTTR